MIKITDEIFEIVEKFPETEKVFKSYDEKCNCCILCTHLFDSPKFLAKTYGLDEKEFLNKLTESIFNNHNK